MLAFAIRRLVEALAVILAVALIAFILFRFVGDPINQMVAQDASLEDRLRLRQDLGLDDPVLLQFARFAAHAVKGDFGMSYQMKQPVVNLIAERFPATMELALAAMLIALALGIPMGVYTAIHRDSWLAKALLAVSLAGISLPTFLIGILLIYLFAVVLHIFPAFGRGDVVAVGFWHTGLLTASGLRALVLPAITLSLFQMTLVTRLVRAEMLEVLRTDYIKFARARGLTEHAINYSHALRNTFHRPATWLRDCLRHRHRDRVPVARHGADVHPGSPGRRHPGYGGVPDPGRLPVRPHQSRCRSPVSAHRSASAGG
jgi:peptide/nickel transport system permease protein